MTTTFMCVCYRLMMKGPWMRFELVYAACIPAWCILSSEAFYNIMSALHLSARAGGGSPSGQSVPLTMAVLSPRICLGLRPNSLSLYLSLSCFHTCLCGANRTFIIRSNPTLHNELLHWHRPVHAEWSPVIEVTFPLAVCVKCAKGKAPPVSLYLRQWRSPDGPDVRFRLHRCLMTHQVGRTSVGGRQLTPQRCVWGVC